MVDFGFYTNEYLGSRIPEKVFAQQARRAEEILCRFERICKAGVTGELSRNMALCAMAETLYEHSCRRGAASQSVGGVSVRYESGANLQRQLFEKAAIYLDLRRGLA